MTKNEILEKIKTMRDHFIKEAQLENSKSQKCKQLLDFYCAKAVILDRLVSIIETGEDDGNWK